MPTKQPPWLFHNLSFSKQLIKNWTTFLAKMQEVERQRLQVGHFAHFILKSKYWWRHTGHKCPNSRLHKLSLNNNTSYIYFIQAEIFLQFEHVECSTLTAHIRWQDIFGGIVYAILIPDPTHLYPILVTQSSPHLTRSFFICHPTTLLDTSPLLSSPLLSRSLWRRGCGMSAPLSRGSKWPGRSVSSGINLMIKGFLCLTYFCLLQSKSMKIVFLFHI